MAIPILSDVFDGIKWVIDFFINKVPTPLKFLIFLFLLLIAGSLIPVVIHLSGVHCNSGLHVVKTSPLKVVENVRIMFISRDDVYNSSAFVPTTNVPFANCVWNVCNNSGTYYYYLADECENETTEYKLQSAGDYFGCVYCNKTSIDVRSADGYYDNLNYVCDGDAYKIPYDEMNWFQKTFCDEQNDCMPPVHYYFDSTTGLYTCLDLEYCGVNSSNYTVNYLIDETLLESDAKLLYPNVDSDDYRKALLIKCNTEMKPELTFYGVNLFSYVFWVLIMIIYILIMFLFKLNNTN